MNRAGWLALSIVVACANADLAPPPEAEPPPTGTPPENAEPSELQRWAALMKELAAELRVAGEPCSAVARTMKTFVQTHADELRTSYRALFAWEASTAKRTVDAFYRELWPVLDVRIDAGIRCRADRATVEAFDSYFAISGLDGR